MNKKYNPDKAFLSEYLLNSCKKIFIPDVPFRLPD